MEHQHSFSPEPGHSAALLRLLAEAGRALASSFDYGMTLDQLARLLVPTLADSCVVDLLGPDGGSRAVANIPPAVSDAGLAAAQDDEHLAMLRELPAASALVVPLLHEGRTLGTISLGRAAARPAYSPLDLRVAEEIAALASLAVANAERYAAAQANAARLAMLQEISAALSQALTPAEVERVVVDQAIGGLGAYAGSLALLAADGAALLPVQMRGYDEATRARWREIPLSSSAPLAEAVRRQEPIWVSSREEWARRYPDLALSAAASRSQAWAALPLLARGRVLGAIGLSFAGPQAFEPAARELITTLASHCAQAIERAGLFDREQQARRALEASVRQQAALAALGQQALAADPLDALFEAAAARVAEALPASHVALYEWQPQEAQLLLRAGVGWAAGAVGQTRVECGDRSLAGYALATGGPVVIHDLAAEARFAVAPLLREHGLVSGVAVVVGGHHDPFGVLGAFVAEARRFTPDDIQFLQTVAATLGGAQDRVRAEAERLLAERQLQEAQRLESLGLLAGGVAHDFNNLLAVIIGNAHLALEELADPPARTALEQIEAAAQRAADLTRQMLAFVGKGQFAVEPTDLTALVVGLLPLLQAAVAPHIALHVRLDPALPAVEADPVQLQQVLLNLVINAAEAIGEREGTISITTGVRQIAHAEGSWGRGPSEPAPGLYVYLEVLDTGPGMDEATRARIFEPFFSTKFAGRGLGLAAAQGIVRRHRGAMQAASAPGAGTRLTVLLPAGEGRDPQAGLALS